MEIFQRRSVFGLRWDSGVGEADGGDFVGSTLRV